MSSCGVGGWGGPQPGDPSNNSVLSAVTAFGGIDVTWTLPSTNPFAVAYVRLFRGPTADFGSALLHAEVGGGFFHDRINTPTRYYYWIQLVSIYGTFGETIGPASAVASPTIAGVIEQLTGQIDEGLLATTLRNKLSEIDSLNQNLLDEIVDRETGQTTLAQALEDVQNGVAQAHTFILNETNSRTTQNAAIVEQINGIVATIGEDYGAVIQEMQVDIDELTGTVNAQYYVKLDVNGFVGGFGLLNNGASVEAGFDVDRFWIGRTNADRRKPFIIDSGVVYIDEAAIQKLTFSKLRDEAGSFLVENGKVKADYISGRGLTITDALGNILLNAGAGTFTGNVTGQVGGTNVATLLTNLGSAMSNASEANNAIADMTSDSKLSPMEKQTIKKEWDVLVAEKTGLNNQATTFSITTENTNYNNFYALMDAYFNSTTLLSNAAGTVSAGTAMLADLTTTSDLNKTYASLSAGPALRKLVADFYTARQALLNRIAGRAKELADGAQSTASGAQTAANNAQTTANTAQTNATNALTTLGNITNDAILSPDEKPAVVLEYNTIVAEKTGIFAQATAYNITTLATAYNTAYDNLVTYLASSAQSPVAWNNYSGNTNIVRSTFIDRFTSYYTARQNLLNEIYNQARTRAQTAQAQADFAATEVGLRLRNDSRNVLAGSGGLATGNLQWDASGQRTSGWGVGFTQRGITAFNSAGVNTFSIDGTTGNATFAGTLGAATGTFAGSLSAATGTFAGTLTAAAVNAVSTINIAGESVGIVRSVGGTTTSVSTNFTVPAGVTAKVIALGFQREGGGIYGVLQNLTISNATLGSTSMLIPHVILYFDNGEASGPMYGSGPVAMSATGDFGPGTHTVTLTGLNGILKELVVFVSLR